MRSHSLKKIFAFLPSKQLLYFSVVGFCGFIADASVLHLLIKYAKLHPIPARVGSFFCAVTVTWLLNRSLTFRANAGRITFKQWLRYFIANSFGGSINLLVYSILVLSFPLMFRYPVLALAIASCVAFIANFTGSKFFAFK